MSDARLTSLAVNSVFARTGPSPCVLAEGKNPGLFWLGGFKSDMKGTKAEALDRWAER